MRRAAVIVLAVLTVAGATTCRGNPPWGGRTTTTASPSTTAGPGGPGPSIPAPVADDCIRDVRPGDHRFTCGGVQFLVMVGDDCVRTACGLIFDVHGAAMSGQIQREDTRLHELGAQRGYLVVHPSAPSSTWNLQSHPPVLADFMERMIRAFHVDTRRVHVTGFSMGSAVTFWFLCNRPDLVASTGPVTGASAEQVRVAATGRPCIESIDANWRPRVPILFMSGTRDNALTIAAARARAEGIVNRLGLTGGQQIAGDSTYTRRRWTGADGMVFDLLEHDYTNALLAGHCIPGEPNANFIACSERSSLHWGRTVLDWFAEHPKP